MQRSHIQRALGIGAAIAVLSTPACSRPHSLAPARMTPQQAVDALIAADRAYSASSATTDVAQGLGAMFDADVSMNVQGVMSRGRDAAVERLRSTTGDPGAHATWTPARGGISADGQHGFSVGYLTVARTDGTRTPFKYVSYWIRRGDAWHVLAYRRSPSGNGDVPAGMMSPALPERMVPAGETTPAMMASLDSAERAFSRDAQRIGIRAAFAEYGTPDAVNVGPATRPGFVVGADAIAAGFQPTGSPVSWGPDRVFVASSGDLGVSIGRIFNNAAVPADTTGIPFFTIWRRPGARGAWKYVAE